MDARRVKGACAGNVGGDLRVSENTSVATINLSSVTSVDGEITINPTVRWTT